MPIYNATDGMLNLFEFLFQPVLIVSDIVSVLGNIPGFSTFFPSYTSGKPYDWVDMAFDLMADFEGLQGAGTIATIANDALQIVVYVDTAVDDMKSLGAGLSIPSATWTSPARTWPCRKSTSPATVRSARWDKPSAISPDWGAPRRATRASATPLPEWDRTSSILGSDLNAGSLFSTIGGDLSNLQAQDPISGATGQPTSQTTTNWVADLTFPFFQNPSIHPGAAVRPADPIHESGRRRLRQGLQLHSPGRDDLLWHPHCLHQSRRRRRHKLRPAGPAPTPPDPRIGRPQVAAGGREPEPARRHLHRRRSAARRDRQRRRHPAVRRHGRHEPDPACCSGWSAPASKAM